MGSAEDHAWAAGFIDGEGSIELRRQRGYNLPRISVGQVIEAPLTLLSTMFGGVVGVRDVRPGRWRPLYHWSITGRIRVGGMLAAISPYLVVKAEEAAIVLAFIDRMRTTEGWSRRALSAAERAERMELVDRLAALRRPDQIRRRAHG